MRLSIRLCLAACLALVLMAAPAAAQTPDTGLIGVGADIGAFFPDEAFEKTLAIDGFADWYLTPRISLRAMLAWASPGFENRTEDNFRQAKLLFNGVYNWEFVEWHPFVTAGAGAYFVRQLIDGQDDPDAETRGGLNFGGGVEYFTGDMSAIKAEARWDIVSHPPGLPDATGFTLTIGFKRYF
jgi:Outer membrane protein beta-barrel domain